MPSYTMLNVKMQRDSNTVPWGFRMQGGKDFASPLQIQKVNSGSLAERCGMEANDYIIKIGSVSTENFKHQDAQEHIRQQNNYLELTLQRGAPPDVNDYNANVQFPPHQLMEGEPSKLSSVSNDRPTYSSSPQVAMPITNNRALLSQAHNTPIGLYSADNVTETITRTLKSLNMKPEYVVQEPKNYDDFRSNVVRAITKVDPVPSAQKRPALASSNPPPVATRPYPPVRQTNNDNVHDKKSSENQGFTKAKKGTALLNRNEAAQQVATCYTCGTMIRGPYISAIGRYFCVNHFKCSKCSLDLIDSGFVEENGKLYCERDFEQYLAPHCAKCSNGILKECVHALEKTWHPECFTCAACRKSIGTGSFHVEEGQPYCVEDYRRMFQEKCTGCDFPIEPGDKYLEAMGGIYHVECFTCSMCQMSLNGHPFVIKNNRPYCRLHGR